MTALGSFGSSDFQTSLDESDPEKSSAPVIVLEDPLSTSLATIRQLIASGQSASAARAMKMLIALMSKGYDVAEFVAFAVQQVASSDAVPRQLAYVLLTHYAEEAPDSAMLSLNTFQRSLSDPDPLIRAQAVKALSSITLEDALPAIQSAVAQVIGDTSPYVKKAAAFAMIKAAEIHAEEIDSYLPHIERLLGDGSPITFAGAIAAYWCLCPDNIELLHCRFRFICQNLHKFDEWTQTITVRSMTIYARYCFRNIRGDDDPTAEFWTDQTNDLTSSDHLMLISAVKRLLSSPSPSVVVASVAFLVYCAPPFHLTAVARPLVRLLYESPAAAEVALAAVAAVAAVAPHVFVPHLPHFYVFQNDRLQVKALKLRVLSALASKSNAARILGELAAYANGADADFASSAVRTMGVTALRNNDVIPDCLVALLRLAGRVSESIPVLAQLFRRKRRTDDEAQALRSLCRKFPTFPGAATRAAILGIVGEMHDVYPEYAPQLLRFLGRRLGEEDLDVRLQALGLAARIIALETSSEVPVFILRTCGRDTEFDVRDRARLLLALLNAPNQRLREGMKTVLATAAKPPKWATQLEETEFIIGSLSQYFGRELPGYEPLPEWAEESEIPPDSVRAPVRKIGGMEIVVGGDEEDEEDEEEEFDINEFFGDERPKKVAEVAGAGDEEDEAEQEEEAEADEADAPADENADAEEDDLEGFFD
jgi:AP-3 complex subunit beta